MTVKKTIRFIAFGLVLAAATYWGTLWWMAESKQDQLNAGIAEMRIELERVGGKLASGPKGATIYLERSSIDMAWLNSHLKDEVYNGVQEIVLPGIFDNQELTQLEKETPRLQGKIRFVNIKYPRR